MGVEVRPLFEPPIGGLLFEAEGKALADSLRRIHSFSGKRGLRPITDFVTAEDDPKASWHPAAEGLQAVRELAEAIRADPKAKQRWN